MNIPKITKSYLACIRHWRLESLFYKSFFIFATGGHSHGVEEAIAIEEHLDQALNDHDHHGHSHDH